MPKYKPEQQAAIDAQGKTIVSASAGSGKTTVMIEKIVGLILSGVEVDKILAVTFTKKAAAQMKEKLREKIIDKINAPTTDRAQREFLKGQLSLVATADICTIHSFCAKLLRQNFCEGEVSNTFSIVADGDADGKTLFAAAIDEAFSEGYASGDSDLLRLVSLYYKKKSDTALKGLLAKCYSDLRSRDDYKEYLSACGDDSRARFDEICARLLADLQARCNYYYQRLGEELAFFDAQKKCETSKKVILALTEYLADMLSRKDYFDCVAIAARKFPSSQSIKAETPEEIAAHIRRVKGVTVEVKEMQSALLAVAAKEEEYARFGSSMKTAKALAKYLLILDEKYQKVKAEKDVLDYADLEHFALRLLQKESIRAELKGKYSYVFVDEYQDVNMVQEKLLSFVAGKDLFLVGDVKQAIYAFRGSKSEIFTEKERAYKKEGHNALDLPHNFRSATDILDAVNAQFAMMMGEAGFDGAYVPMQTGGLYVDKDGQPAKGRVRVYFYKTEEKKEKEPLDGVYSVKTGKKKGKKRHSAQIKKVLEIIRREVKYGRWFDIQEKDEDKRYKKVGYGDIAILYRGTGGEVRDLVTALADEEIPTVGGETQNICDFPEIRTLVDLLSLLDNERQDIPLCSALVAAQGLTNQDLAAIRIANFEEGRKSKDETFYAACKRHEREGKDALADKLRRFFASLAAMRLYAQVHTAGETIGKLLTEYALETKFLSRKGGGESLQRVNRFVEESLSPQPMSTGEFLEKLKKLDYKITAPVSGGEEAVKMMTMHASKGLEFPVVILIDLSRRLHAVGDSEVINSGDFGLLPFYYDESSRKYHQTLARNLHINEESRGQVRDELNVYYVATTRAKYALHMLFEERTLLPNPKFGKSYQDFTDFSLWENYIYADENYEPVYDTKRDSIDVGADETLVSAMKRALMEDYAFAGLENFPVKDSATGLMRRIAGESAAHLADADYSAQDEGYEYENEGADEDKRLRGLAYHAFLEHFDFDKIGRGDLLAEVRDSLARFAKEKSFDEAYFAYLEEEQLCRILASPIFARLKGCKLYKEQEFLVGLPVAEDMRLRGKDVRDVGRDDTVILYQGAIDLLAVGEEKTYIVDYKFSGGDERYLKEHYAPQLALYKKAVAKITGRKEEEIETIIVNIAKAFEVTL